MADLGELGDLDGEGNFDDPMEERGGVEGVANSAGDAAAKLVTEAPAASPVSSISPELANSIPTDVSTSIQSGLESIPTAGGDSIAGKQIQANVADLVSDPMELSQMTDNALEDAAGAHGGDIGSITPEEFKASLDAEVKAKVDAAKQNFKQQFGQALKDVDPSLDPNGSFTEQLVEDPDSLKNDLQQAADDPNADTAEDMDAKGDEETDPDKKSALKEGAKKLLGYGAKALLVLAVIGALIPGAGGPVDKLANLAGQAITKIIAAAASIAQALFGPFITAFWNFVKKMKGPLIVIGIVLIIIFMVWLYKSFAKKE